MPEIAVVKVKLGMHIVQSAQNLHACPEGVIRGGGGQQGCPECPVSGIPVELSAPHRIVFYEGIQ